MKRLLSTVLLVACGAAEQPPAVPDPAAAVVAAEDETPVERPDFPGVVTAKESKVIPAEFQGSLENIFVHQRQRVKAGDLIAKLDTTDLKAEAASLRAQERSSGAQAAAASATARAAAATAKTESRLYNRGFQSRNAKITAQARLAEARGQIGAAGEQAKSLRVRREQIEEQIKKANHPSPIDGVITVIKQKEGDVIQRGTPIARVFDDSDLIIRFAVPKEYRNLLKLGGRVELTVDGTPQPIWASITNIADEEPPISFSVVTADIDDSKLRPDEIQVAKDGRVRLVEEPSPPAPPPAAAPTPTATTAASQPAQAGANR